MTGQLAIKGRGSSCSIFPHEITQIRRSEHLDVVNRRRDLMLMAVEIRAFLAMSADLDCWSSRAIRG